jgi:hypothetical protein
MSRTTITMPLPVCAIVDPAPGHPDPPLDQGAAGPPVDRRVRSALAGARERTASVADLREMIAAGRSEIVESGADTQQRMELALELRRIVAALEPARPDLTPVRERWKRVLGLLGPAAGTGRVAQITDLLILLLRRR